MYYGINMIYKIIKYSIPNTFDGSIPKGEVVKVFEGKGSREKAYAHQKTLQLVAEKGIDYYIKGSFEVSMYARF
mgnify:CR=1 FL=1|tara:strand:+ start:339 stop:560 length:222 start_codon:yes stop_codon:yes gene_type:complete